METPVSSQPPAAPCPKCGSTSAKKVNYTWWGGFIGPKMFNHVRCTQCHTTYNARTGRSNVLPVIIYNVVILSVCLVLALVLSLAMR